LLLDTSTFDPNGRFFDVLLHRLCRLLFLGIRRRLGAVAVVCLVVEHHDRQAIEQLAEAVTRDPFVQGICRAWEQIAVLATSNGHVRSVRSQSRLEPDV
jgi:hypothetical protein